jgi:hypothetical protein
MAARKKPTDRQVANELAAMAMKHLRTLPEGNAKRASPSLAAAFLSPKSDIQRERVEQHAFPTRSQPYCRYPLISNIQSEVEFAVVRTLDLAPTNPLGRHIPL